MGKLNESVGDDEASTAISRRDFPEKQLKMHLNASKMRWILISRFLLHCFRSWSAYASKKISLLNQQTLPSPYLWALELMNSELHVSCRREAIRTTQIIAYSRNLHEALDKAALQQVGACDFISAKVISEFFVRVHSLRCHSLAMSGLVLKISYSVPSHSASGTMNWEAEKILHSKENSNYATNKSQAGNY